jgi:hypothetical protein
MEPTIPTGGQRVIIAGRRHPATAQLAPVLQRRMTQCAAAIVFALAIDGSPGCIPSCLFGDARGTLFVIGQLATAETDAPFAGGTVSVRTFTASSETARAEAVLFGAQPTPGLPAPRKEGEFVAPLSTDLGPACRPPTFPRPDQVEVIVVRDGCEQSFVIDINADTVVDLRFPDDVIELKDPILVPPCEP